MLYAAGILLLLALTIVSYRLGIQAGARNAAAFSALSRSSAQIIPEKEHDRLVAELADRDQTISELKKEITSKRNGREKERVHSSGSASLDRAGMLLKNGRSTGITGSTSADARTAELEKQLADVQRARSDVGARTAALEANARELGQQLRDRSETVGRQQSSLADANRLLQERNKTIANQQDWLAHDRDIRELMGSRNLYIAEVYDVGKTGQTCKPFGRVFYTKGKSLIFYAYDLDQQPSVEKAASFQVWGREGTNQSKTVSLGVFYEDSVANKRWVLKSGDTKSLEHIDAVFVTIEPNGGSQKPSGHPLLFANLNTAPNHP
jgi:hypothetical protein